MTNVSGRRYFGTHSKDHERRSKGYRHEKVSTTRIELEKPPRTKPRKVTAEPIQDRELHPSSERYTRKVNVESCNKDPHNC